MADNTINHSKNSNITIMNSTCEEYIAHLERLLIYKDAVIADKERKIYDLLQTYRLHISEKDRQITRLVARADRRYELKIAMIIEKDRQISELIHIISEIHLKKVML
ncbi:hypothetical protein FACS1894169_14410 [Bacteroidia bacterium]|nr:hypothetical protein FACS1894169_14410 [Bacteroidia bacterium]